MHWRRNADEGAQRRRRAMSSDSSLVNAVVADKIRAGRASEITLGELGAMDSRELVQRIPTEIWQAMLAKVGGAGRDETIPVQLGPVQCRLEIHGGRKSYPNIMFYAEGYHSHDDYVSAVIEYDSAYRRLRVMVYGDPYDPEGAPSHYINLSPYDPTRPVIAQGDQHVWDAENL